MTRTEANSIKKAILRTGASVTVTRCGTGKVIDCLIITGRDARQLVPSLKQAGLEVGNVGCLGENQLVVAKP
jgi:hypothetical protein